MNINIEDYLSEDEIKRIVEEEFREKIKYYFHTEKDITRFISNIGYLNSFRILDEEIPNFKELIKEQTKKQCENITSYSVFRKKDDYERENSLAQNFLEEAVKENKGIIENRVMEIMDKLSEQDLAYEINGIIEDKITNLFKGA